MIVTFHLAVYFVYNLWNNYISGRIGNGETETDNNEVPNNNNPTSPLVERGNEDDQNKEINLNERNPNTSSEDKDLSNKPQKTRQVGEGEGDFHPCLQPVFSDDEDEGRKLIYDVEPTFDCNYDAEQNIIQFIPPVYVQRYMTVESILKEPCWAESVKKVVDFGCAELSFEMKYLKKLFGLQEIIAVDIDADTLQKNCCKVSPTATDHLLPRPTPLTVRVFCASVAHTHNSLEATDAVIAIELIEHLYPVELECLPFTIFGYMKPKIAIFTTPNADFNVLFPGLTGFRHDDHKFEWSRQQFEDWGNNIVERYPDYQVKFQGIGPGPEGSEMLGCCSQMATFIKVCESNSISENEISIQDGPYNLIQECVFPFFKDERTEEEIVKDEALAFLLKWKLLSRTYDEEFKAEVPLKTIMDRIKYFNRDKLREILAASDWEIKTNVSGDDVVIIPESEDEESDDELKESDSEINEYFNDNRKYCDRVNSNNSPELEENWDYEEVDMDVTLKNYSCNDQKYPEGEMRSDNHCLIDKSFHNLCSVNVETKNESSALIEKVVNSDKFNCSLSKMCSGSETTVPDNTVSDKSNSSQVENVSEKSTGLNLEKSIYETPNNKGYMKSGCDLSNFSPLSEQDHVFKSCQKTVLESPIGFVECDVTEGENGFCCLSTIPSSCDTSFYATPCCSQQHKKNIPKCLSLQQIDAHCSSPTFSTGRGHPSRESELFIEQKDDRFSKSVEGFKSLESDLTCSSTSRVVDSGYPDSYSDYNMDMDLTPEQFDDIETESEGNDASSRSLSPIPPPPQIPWLVDDVQNGDVANNNRDGEGNNLVGDEMEEEPLEFQARIDEFNEELPNLAGADEEVSDELPNLEGADGELNFCRALEPIEENHEDCVDHCLPSVSGTSISDVTNEHVCLSEKSPKPDGLKLKSVFTENNSETSDSLEKQTIRSAKSDSSVITNYSIESQSPCNAEGGSKSHNKQSLTKLKIHNSLTTVLDGCSRFSNCSLVRPVEKLEDTEQSEVTCEDVIPQSVPNSESSHFENLGGIAQVESTSDVHKSASLICTPPYEDCLSLMSVYQSAESLLNPGLLVEDVERSLFPEWLLNIHISDAEEIDMESIDSVESTYDSDSLEELISLDYDVQVDARGGGDPQRDTWH